MSLLDNELYWISGDSIACISNGNVETRCTIVSELNSNVTRIKALKNSDGKKAIVWQQECDSDVNFYGVNYNEVNNAFGTVEPISTDSGIVRGWDASMLPNGQIELAYGFAEKLQEAVNRKPYGQIDLVQKQQTDFMMSMWILLVPIQELLNQTKTLAYALMFPIMDPWI